MIKTYIKRLEFLENYSRDILHVYQTFWHEYETTHRLSAEIARQLPAVVELFDLLESD